MQSEPGGCPPVEASVPTRGLWIPWGGSDRPRDLPERADETSGKSWRRRAGGSAVSHPDATQESLVVSPLGAILPRGREWLASLGKKRQACGSTGRARPLPGL